MSLCPRWIANAWLATFAGALLALANGCGNSSGTPTGVLQNDAATDSSPDQKIEEHMDERPDTAPADSSAGDGAMTASDGSGETAAPDAGMEVGASCTDNARNGNETDTDCGGSCGRCGVGKACLVNADCTSGACSESHVCLECATAANCPGQDTECSVRACVNGACSVALVASGTILQTQVTGDCRSRRCDGQGQVAQVNDDTDVPNDGNPCTLDVCTNGAPSNPPAASSSSCGANQICDGLGHCVGCLTGADCPGTDNACQSRTCEANGVCGVDNAGDGTPAGAQTTGDCRQMVCDGNGATRTAVDDTDVHDDGNPCMANVCNAGVASNPPLAAGSPCPTGVCDGQGHCFVCERSSDCGVDTLCVVHACDAAHTCRVGNVEPGSPVGLQVAGDCHVQQCDGQGSTTSIPDDTDLPDDGNPCTIDICTNGAISHTAVAAGTSCGAGRVCDGQGSCGAAATPDAGAADATGDGGPDAGAGG